MLNVKIKYLFAWNKARGKKAQLYSEFLSNIASIGEPIEADYNKHAYYLHSVCIQGRDRFIVHPSYKSICCGTHYSAPVYNKEPYKSITAGDGRFSIAEKVVGEYVPWPIYRELNKEKIKQFSL